MANRDYVKKDSGIHRLDGSGRGSDGHLSYEGLIRCAEVRKQFLEDVIKKCENELSYAPDGELRVSSKRKKPTYYWRKNDSDKQGTYLSASSMELAEKLAQKSADKRTLQVSEKELKYVTRFLDNYPPHAESVYAGLSETRKKLVLPLEEPDEEFAKSWQVEEYVTNPIPPMDDGLVTERGEIVRSRAELIIANMLNQMKIPYHYEKPLYLEGEGTVYPDMTALNIRERQEKYIEYFGMMHDPDYAAKAVRKIRNYEKSGYYLGDRLIAIFEAGGEPLDTRYVRDLLRKHFL